MSTTTVAVRPVCRHCQTEITEGWERIGDGDECFDCWVQPYCDEAWWEDYGLRVADGSMPVKFVGC